MQNFIALLRGINVSGKNPLKMDRLRVAFEKAGFTNVTTYVQSGNVFFASEETERAKLELSVMRILEFDFGYKIPVMVLTAEKLRNIAGKNPFVADKQKNERFMHVTFLAHAPSAGFDYLPISDKKKTSEEIKISGDVVYLYCPEGYGKTKLNNNFFEAKFKTTATTRNWKTVEALLGLCS